MGQGGGRATPAPSGPSPGHAMDPAAGRGVQSPDAGFPGGGRAPSPLRTPRKMGREACGENGEERVTEELGGGRRPWCLAPFTLARDQLFPLNWRSHLDLKRVSPPAWEHSGPSTWGGVGEKEIEITPLGASSRV